MASGTRLRDAGQRRQGKVKPRVGLLGNSMGLGDGTTAENRLNLEQVYALETMFQTHPAVQAARTVLCGQLLSGGISLVKNGEEVELTPAFSEHLKHAWLPFAQAVIDSFLKWGLAPVAYENDDDDQHLQLAKRAKVEEAPKKSSRAAKAAQQPSAPPKPTVLVPIVPVLGSYEIAFRNGGRAGYKREYILYSNAPGQATKPDDEARVFVRQHPDSIGNVNSPLASVFDLGSFVGALTELALVAESSRARPRIATQMRKKDNNALDPGNLFFDSESRAVQSGADADENAAQARALAMQQSLCQMINKLQTTSTPTLDINTSSFSGGQQGPPRGSKSYAPPDVPPSIFHLPKDQETCSHVSNPESRGDLEALSRLSIEQFSAALGVPSDLIFSGRFAGKSTSQLSLLNITVSELAKATNNVLTAAYRDIYAVDADDDVGNLQLLTSPISSTEEVLQLFAGGLAPLEVALPSVLHSIGIGKEAITKALEDAKAEKEKKTALENADQEFAEKDREMSLKERETGLRAAATADAAKKPANS